MDINQLRKLAGLSAVSVSNNSSAKSRVISLLESKKLIAESEGDDKASVEIEDAISSAEDADGDDVADVLEAIARRLSDNMMAEIKSELGESSDDEFGYRSKSADPADYFPDGADGPVVGSAGPSGAKMGDNPSQKKMAVAESIDDRFDIQYDVRSNTATFVYDGSQYEIDLSRIRPGLELIPVYNIDAGTSSVLDVDYDADVINCLMSAKSNSKKLPMVEDNEARVDREDLELLDWWGEMVARGEDVYRAKIDDLLTSKYGIDDSAVEQLISSFSVMDDETRFQSLYKFLKSHSSQADGDYTDAAMHDGEMGGRSRMSTFEKATRDHEARAIHESLVYKYRKYLER